MAAFNGARDGHTALALRLAKHLALSPTAAASNVVFSPVSVHAALALLAAGARGATLAQLLAFLGAPSANELAEFGRHVVHRVLADRSDSGACRVDDASPGLLADAFRHLVDVVESYDGDDSDHSGPDVGSWQREEAVKMINEWVKRSTDNLIDTIISPDTIDDDTDLVLANAVYFKGEWLRPFSYGLTRRSPFHRLDGSCVQAEFMSDYRTNELVASVNGFKVLKLPYKTGREDVDARAGQPCRGHSTDKDTQYSMFIFLPDRKDGIATMVDVLTAAPTFMYGILDKMNRKFVYLKLPKFKITFNWELGDALNQLGLTLPFSPVVADLSGMCKEDKDIADDGGDNGSRRPMSVSKVAHMTVTEVNELGTEAAAVTRTNVIGGGYPPADMVEFVADHPFTFFIMEERSGVIVFAGHVMDPTKK